MYIIHTHGRECALNALLSPAPPFFFKKDQFSYCINSDCRITLHIRHEYKEIMKMEKEIMTTNAPGDTLPEKNGNIDAAHLQKLIESGDYTALKSVKIGDLPEELRSKIYMQAVGNRLTATAEQNIEIAGRSIGDLLKIFVDGQRSKHTRIAYRHAVQEYFNYSAQCGINPLDATHSHAVNYANYQRDKRAGTGSNTHINSVSSFYNFLFNDGIVKKNPFYKIKRVAVSHEAKRVISAEKIKAAIERARKRDQQHIADAILLLANTGLRVGALSSYKAVADGTRYRVWTKGKDHIGYIPMNCRHITGGLWKGTNTQSIARQIARYLCGYSAHDLRHFYAIQAYQATGYNIAKVSRLLGHANIAITTTYLKGLGAIETDGLEMDALGGIDIAMNE